MEHASMAKKKRKSLSLAKRKRIIAAIIEAAIADAKPKHQQKLADHALSTSMLIVGMLNGVDLTGAVMLVPDDSTMKLLVALNAHAERSNVSSEKLCEQLIAILDQPGSMGVN